MNTIPVMTNEIFRKNYTYMWEKLSTNYHAVCNSERKPAGIINQQSVITDRGIKKRTLLPSYTLLWKLHARPDELPTINTVNKIVSFYNANIEPSISTHDFLYKDLSALDHTIYVRNAKRDTRFEGKYYGYYFSVNGGEKITGAMIRFFVQDEILKVRMVTGITSDEEFHGERLKQLFDKTEEHNPSEYSITKADYDEYYHSIPYKVDQRCTYYEGIAELTSFSLTATCYSRNPVSKKFFLNMDISKFTPNITHNYFGGMAFVMTSSDGAGDAQFYQMALIAEDCEHLPFSLNDPRFKEILKIQEKGNGRVALIDVVEKAPYLMALRGRDPETFSD